MQTQVIEDRLDTVVLAWLWCQRGKPATPAAATTGVKAMLPAGSAVQLVPAALERLTGGQTEARDVRAPAQGSTCSSLAHM